MSWKEERDCGILEKWVRRFITSLFYYRGYRKLHPDYPYYVPRAVQRIENLINKNNRVFEWGSGVSSLWYTKKVGKYICVEHSQEWYNQTYKTFKENKIKNAEIIFSSENISLSDFSWEKQWPYYHILNHPPANPQFRDYMAVIDQYPDNYFDCIVVDGRERIGCLVHAVPKLAEQGFLILDDSHRPQYKEAFTILKDWTKEQFDFGLAQTTIFYRDIK